jgi:hypothetical protein
MNRVSRALVIFVSIVNLVRPLISGRCGADCRSAAASIQAASTSILEYAARRCHGALPVFGRSGSDHRHCDDALANEGRGDWAARLQQQPSTEFSARRERIGSASFSGVTPRKPENMFGHHSRIGAMVPDGGEHGDLSPYFSMRAWTADLGGQDAHSAGHLPLEQANSASHRIRRCDLSLRIDTLSASSQWHG